MSRSIGTAYGSFDTKASKQAVEEELPFLKEMSQAPKNLGLSLIPSSELRGAEEIKRMSLEAGHKFVIVASLPGETNKNAANHLADIFNQMYNSPLFDYGEDFRGGIAYFNESGEVTFHE